MLEMSLSRFCEVVFVVGIIFILFILGILIFLIVKSLVGGDANSDFYCPHGYESFGCQPCCPLYEHCWGKRDD